MFRSISSSILVLMLTSNLLRSFRVHPLLHCTKQGSLEHKAWPGPCWQVVLPDWKHLLPVAMHLHGIGRAPTATLLHMRWVSMHLHRYRGGGGLACRIGFVSTSMSVWHAWYLQGGFDLFRLFVEIGRPFKQKKKRGGAQ